MSPTYTAESDPLDEMKTLIEDNWVGFKEIGLPQIIVANDPSDPVLRLELNLGDAIVIKMAGTETLKQVANFNYYNRFFPIVVEIYTKVSRQRMRDLGKMVRMICNDKKHAFPSYQLIRYSGQDESVEENLNIWRYRFRFQLESNVVAAESLTD